MTGADRPLDPLAAFLAELAQQPEVPSFAASLERIARLTNDADASALLISDAIRQDVSLTGRILRIANSAMYRRQGVPVADVRQAVLLIGFERVKDFALGASVFDELRRRGSGLEELLASSLLSANHALHLALASDYARPEEAYLAGLFALLGETAMACWLPERHARVAQSLAQSAPDRAAAARGEFGFRFEDLGVALARRWNFPPQLVAALQPNDAVPPRTPVTGTVAHLPTLLRCASTLTEVIYRGPQAFDGDRLAAALQSWGPPLALDVGGALEVVSEARIDAGTTLRSLRFPADRLAQLQRGELAERVLEAISRGEGTRARRGVAVVEGQAGGAASGPPERALAALEQMRDLRASTAGDDATLTALVSAALEGLIGAGFDRAIFALANAQRSELRGRLVSPTTERDAIERFVIPLRSDVDFLGNMLRAGSDIFVPRVSSSALRTESPFRELRARRLVLLPLTAGDALLGALYADGTVPVTRFPEGVQGVCREIRNELNRFLGRQLRA